MSYLILPVTLVFAGALTLVHIWLAFRVGQVRTSEKVSVGDGGNERVIRRMRAHANFGENGPLAIALLGLIELGAGTSLWLWSAAAVFVAARVAHGLGMDGWRAGRSAGTLLTALVLLVLAIWAIALPLLARDHHEPGIRVEAIVPPA